MAVTCIEAQEGMVLTNGVVFGTTIYLADGTDPATFYNITKEEYKLLVSQNAESNAADFWDEFTNLGERADYSYAFANWSQSTINPGAVLIANKAIYMFMNCKNLTDASNIHIIIKNDNPSMQGFCMGSLLMTQPPNIAFKKKDGTAVAVTKTWISAFANCVKMESCCVYLGDGTQNPVTTRNSMQNTFVNCDALKDLIFEGKGSPIYLDLSDCKELSHESMQSLKSALMDVSEATSGNYDIKISAETAALLSEEEVAEFAALGWDLVTVEK